jgi:hypothetical protein
MPKKFKKLETVLENTKSFTVNGVSLKPLITICMNSTQFVLPTWFAYMIPVFQGFMDTFEDADIIVDIDPELIPFIPEIKKLFEEMFTARYGFVKYTPIHAETLIILNFLGFADPIAIRFFKTIKITTNKGNVITVPGSICTTKEYFLNLEKLNICTYRKKYITLTPHVTYNIVAKLLGMENISYNQLFIYTNKLQIIDEPIINIDKLHISADLAKYCENVSKWRASITKTLQKNE